MLLFLPTTPLLFMGQEFAASTPFLFFTDHDAGAGRLVTEGRRKEFAGFAASPTRRAASAIPDPQAVATFRRSKPDHWSEREAHAGVYALYRELLACAATIQSCGTRIGRRRGHEPWLQTSWRSAAGTRARSVCYWPTLVLRQADVSAPAAGRGRHPVGVRGLARRLVARRTTAQPASIWTVPARLARLLARVALVAGQARRGVPPPEGMIG